VLRRHTENPEFDRGLHRLGSARGLACRFQRSRRDAFDLPRRVDGGRSRFAIQQHSRAFTLLELLIVIAIISILLVLVAPAFTYIKRGNDITTAASMVTGVLAQARNHAMANNTYVYVGFYEEVPTLTWPTNATPPYPGKGRVVLASVASKDGTTSCEDPNSSTSNRIPLIASRIIQIGKLVKVEGVHMTDIGAPPDPTPSPTPPPDSIDGRPHFPYTFGSPMFDYQNRINSDDTHSPENQTLYPFVTQGYTFYKTVRFNPRGEANINGTYALRRAAEIGFRPTHGAVVDMNGPNVVAIQFSGIGGNFKIYRR
jgi:prepilin-type N-terminal cleavage/methylation domain-containing protein